MNIRKAIRVYPFVLMLTITSVFFGLGYFGLQLQKQYTKRIDVGSVEANNQVTQPEEVLEVETILPPEVGEESISTNEIIVDQIPEEIMAKEFHAVESSYFDDALFIGDSRSVGLKEYGTFSNATFYVTEGLTIWKALEAKLVETETENETVLEGLSHNKFGKIYIMIGINELGRGDATMYFQQFQSVIATIRQLQPEAMIFIQSIMHVSEKKNNEGTYINNEAINERNEKLKTLEDKDKIFYLNVNDAMDDEKGYLHPDYSFDGVHLKANHIKLWEEYLLQNGI